MKMEEPVNDELLNPSQGGEESDAVDPGFEPEEGPQKSGGIAAMLGRFDSAGESGLKRVLLNLPFVLFLVGLAVLHIANNHMAENYARRIVKTEREVKQLRWQYMTSASSLMLKSKQSEVARLVQPLGLAELRVPPNKIETKN